MGYGGHALAITDIQENTSTFVNPWDTSVEYNISWEEFANLGIGYICSANLDNSKISKEITDMTNTKGGYNFEPNIEFYSDENFNKDIDYDFYEDFNNSNQNYDSQKGFDFSYLTNLLNYLIDFLKAITE